MARILVLFVMIVTVAAAHRHHPHPKLMRAAEDYDASQFKHDTVACSSENEQIRADLIENSKCGTPKEVFVELKPQAHEQVSPGAVWVKRCTGLCDHHSYGSSCVPLQTITKQIPIRLYNVKTNKERCSTYEVEEHVSCGCCSGSPESCLLPRVYDPPESDYEVESI